MGTERTRTRRGTLIGVILLLLSTGSIYEWWRSQSNFTSLRYGGFVAMTAEGKICLLHSSTAPAGPVKTGLHSVPYDHADKEGIIVRWPNFDCDWTTDPARAGMRVSVVAPLWFMALLFAVPSAWWFSRGRQAASIADEMG